MRSSPARPSGHRPLLGSAALSVAAVAVLAGCAGGGSPAGGASPAAGQAGPMGCQAGPYRLTVNPAAAVPGQTVTLSAQGPWPVRDTVHDVTTGSYGLLGAAVNGRFQPVYYLAAVLPGFAGQRNVRYGPRTGIGGAGLPNRPFRVAVPPVSSGRYIVKFDYTVTAGSQGTRRSLFHLCARLRVTR